MTDDPWLSILIPVFNVELYLRECVESILRQADEQVEVVLLDDCATDGSAALMRSLSDEWPGRLRLMAHDRNRGLSAARNTMLATAKGRYVWFVDSDDKLMPGALSELKTIVNQHGPDLILCDFKMWRYPTKLKHRLRGELHRRTFKGPVRTLLTDRSAMVEGMFAPGHMHIWSKISKRELWADGLRFPEGRYFEDMPVTSRLALKARSCYYQDSVWVAYRQRAGSILSAMTEKKAKDLSQALLGYRQEALRCSPPLSEDALFSVDYCAARNFICVARYAKKVCTPEVDEIFAQARVDFESSITAGLSEVCARYRRNGWLWRWQRLVYWLRTAPTALSNDLTDSLPAIKTISINGNSEGSDGSLAEVPKIIWSFWHDDNLPLMVQRCVESWRRFNPDFRVELLNERNINKYIAKEELPLGFSGLSNFRKADWLRLALVARYGGIWLDSTIVLTRSLDWMLEAVKSNGLFSGFYLEGYTGKSNRPIIENWCFAAPAGNNFVVEWYAAFTQEVIEASETHFLEKIKSEGLYDDIVGGIDDPHYLAAHVAAQYVIYKAGPFPMRLFRAEDSAYLHHVQSGWKCRKIMWLIFLKKSPLVVAPLIKLRKKERQKGEFYLRNFLILPGSIGWRYLCR